MSTNDDFEAIVSGEFDPERLAELGQHARVMDAYFTERLPGAMESLLGFADALDGGFDVSQHWREDVMTSIGTKLGEQVGMALGMRLALDKPCAYIDSNGTLIVSEEIVRITGGWRGFEVGERFKLEGLRYWPSELTIYPSESARHGFYVVLADAVLESVANREYHEELLVPLAHCGGEMHRVIMQQ
jgi:hypothetical protein